MENASKALIIAGGVLIAVLLLTVFSYLFGKMASSTSSIYETLEKHEIDEFNQQFLNYEGKDLKVQDVATLINLAEDSKNNSKLRAEVKITLEGSTQNSEDLLKTNIDTRDIYKYKCDSVHINPNTLLVDEVKISLK